ncbi:MAG: 4-hydroxy-tetrahydrodipicolinate reductase, partial [Thermodesulfobacteriota bacterium]
MTTRVIVSGAAGRMGRRICDIVNRNPRLELSGALEHQ